MKGHNNSVVEDQIQRSTAILQHADASMSANELWDIVTEALAWLTGGKTCEHVWRPTSTKCLKCGWPKRS